MCRVHCTVTVQESQCGHCYPVILMLMVVPNCCMIIKWAIGVVWLIPVVNGVAISFVDMLWLCYPISVCLRWTHIDAKVCCVCLCSVLRVCACACARATHTHVCVYACACECVCTIVLACMHAYKYVIFIHVFYTATSLWRRCWMNTLVSMPITVHQTSGVFFAVAMAASMAPQTFDLAWRIRWSSIQ